MLTETINDLDGFACNFWRALKQDPDKVSGYADHPIIESDLHARHAWMTGKASSLQTRLEGDPDWCDFKIAGWWVWGINCKLGGSFCAEGGPWHRVKVKGQWHLLKKGIKSSEGINRIIPMGNRCGILSVSDKKMKAWLRALSVRLKYMHICCGDWSRVCTPRYTTGSGRISAVFLDPPYAGGKEERRQNVYRKDSDSISAKVREWAIANGGNRRIRIALCGYNTEHTMPPDWEVVRWKAAGGFSNANKDGSKNAGKLGTGRERIWFSPHCLKSEEVFM